LINKDIPDLRDALGIDLRATLSRVVAIIFALVAWNISGTMVIAPSTMRVWQRFGSGCRPAESGDRNELNLNGPTEREIMDKVLS
jgi:hypothetical protein